MTIFRRTCPLFLIAMLATGAAQTNAPSSQASVPQIARLIDVSRLLEDCATVECNQLDPQTATTRQLAIRQEISEAVMAASLDVDDVLAEIANEHARLMELRSVLESRRDRAVNLVSIGNLVIGSGVGILVNALQFKNSTAIAGDAVGVASGAAATALSIVGIHLQNGPQHAIGRTPNMLAVLFDRPPVLHSDYPKTVLAYLNSVPEGEPAGNGTRLDQLRGEWHSAGRLGVRDTVRARLKIDVLTSSLNAGRKLSIADLTDRAFMLEDVAGRVGLMKRDLADLMRSLRRP